MTCLSGLFELPALVARLGWSLELAASVNGFAGILTGIKWLAGSGDDF